MLKRRPKTSNRRGIEVCELATVFTGSLEEGSCVAKKQLTSDARHTACAIVLHRHVVSTVAAALCRAVLCVTAKVMLLRLRFILDTTVVLWL